MLGIQTDDVQQLADALDTLLLGTHAMNGHGLGDDLADGHTGIERSIGILEDELHLATHILDLVLAHLGNVFALEEHFACRRLGQTHDGAARGGLTATRLADQAKGLARINLERNVIHSRDDTLREALGEHAGLCGKLLGEVLDLQQRSALVIVCHLRLASLLGILARTGRLRSVLEELGVTGIVARRIVTGLGDNALRALLAALVRRVGATRREDAALRQVHERRRVAVNRRQRLLLFDCLLRDGADKTPGVGWRLS